MKHPLPEEWSDYVRGTLRSGAGAGLEKHLNGGCAKCARQVGALEVVNRLAQAELHSAPPATAVSAAKNLFRIQRLIESSKPARIALDLSFDSFLTPAGAGVRGAATGERHLVFRSPQLLVDLELRTAENGKPVRLRGQLLDGESKPIADVPAFLLDQGEVSAQDLSGRVGEFSLRAEARSTTRLCLLLGEDLVEVPLPDPLRPAASPPAH